MRYRWSRDFRALGLVSVFLSLLTLAACGVSANGAGYGAPVGSASAATATTATSTGAPGAGIVATSTASVGGVSTMLLTDSSGRTLYYFDADSAKAAACTVRCVSTWPPLLVSSGTPTSTSNLPGTLSAGDVGNGQQVLYNGHPLYRYSGDAAPGDTNGNGIEGKWHVATPDVAENSATPSGGATPTPCSGYYCYGGAPRELPPARLVEVSPERPSKIRS